MRAILPPRRTPAFTLIELLVVVSIIALLIAILLPSLKKARIQAKNAKDATQLHAIGLALGSYNTSYGRFPPQNSLGQVPPTVQPRDQRSAPGFWTYSVHKEIASYMGGLRQSNFTDASGVRQRTKAHEVFFCPFVPAEKVIDSGTPEGNPERYLADNLSGTFPDGTRTNFGIPNAEDVYLHVSYVYYGALNECANDPAEPRSNQERTSGVPRWRKLYAKLEPDATRVLMADSVALWAGGNQWRINHVDRGLTWGEKRGAARGDFRPPAQLVGANEAFGDGHVEWKPRTHFTTLLSCPSGAMGYLQLTLRSGLAQGLDCFWW